MNHIIEELNAVAALEWNKPQKSFYIQRAKDARPVQCVRMRDVFTSEQMAFIRGNYKTQQRMCYKNASTLVGLLAHPWAFLFDEPVKYVEGFAYSCGLLPIEHAFVKVGDRYIDPTFERALKKDVRKEEYVSCIELDYDTMRKYQSETGYYGELYLYDYLLRHEPRQAESWRRLKR